MNSAALINISFSEFWELTPFEFSLKLNSFNKQKKEEQEEKLTLTYLGALWQRVKKMPDLKDIIKQEQKEMTSEQILAQIKSINTALGGTVY